MIAFEFDENKNPSNLDKNGIGLAHAQQTWKAEEHDQKFDNGENILASLDLSKAKRTMQDQKRVNVDFPAGMLESLDKEASR